MCDQLAGSVETTYERRPGGAECRYASGWASNSSLSERPVYYVDSAAEMNYRKHYAAYHPNVPTRGAS